MLDYLLPIVELVILFLFIFWISKDIEKRGIDKKKYWVWTIAGVVALLLFGLLGLFLIALGYYFWSRNMR